MKVDVPEDGGLNFRVNTESAIAVYVQIQNQIQFAIASGLLGPGDMLPSVRDVSDGIGVNPNTVAKAYRDLELRGLVFARRGVGYRVVEKNIDGCRARVRKMVLRHLREAVAECAASGITATEMRGIIRETLASDSGPY